MNIVSTEWMDIFASAITRDGRVKVIRMPGLTTAHVVPGQMNIYIPEFIPQGLNRIFAHLLIHECGHLLYTEPLKDTTNIVLMNGKTIPFMQMKFQNFWRKGMNLFEDYRIDLILGKRYERYLPEWGDIQKYFREDSKEKIRKQIAEKKKIPIDQVPDHEVEALYTTSKYWTVVSVLWDEYMFEKWGGLKYASKSEKQIMEMPDVAKWTRDNYHIMKKWIDEIPKQRTFKKALKYMWEWWLYIVASGIFDEKQTSKAKKLEIEALQESILTQEVRLQQLEDEMNKRFASGQMTADQKRKYESKIKELKTRVDDTARQYAEARKKGVTFDEPGKLIVHKGGKYIVAGYSKAGEAIYKPAYGNLQ